MKKGLTIILGLVLAFGVSKAIAKKNSGINFKADTLSNILSQATTEEKLVFVDVSTSWCHYCKKMKAGTYSNGDVEAYFNKNYVNVMFDAEKGEGRAIAKKYGVRGYPTQLILDSNGKLLKKNAGYLKPDQLLKFARLK